MQKNLFHIFIRRLIEFIVSFNFLTFVRQWTSVILSVLMILRFWWVTRSTRIARTRTVFLSLVQKINDRRLFVAWIDEKVLVLLSQQRERAREKELEIKRIYNLSNGLPSIFIYVYRYGVFARRPRATHLATIKDVKRIEQNTEKSNFANKLFHC